MGLKARFHGMVMREAGEGSLLVDPVGLRRGYQQRFTVRLALT